MSCQTQQKLGGAPANFAYHVSKFGLAGLAVSAIGKDADGEEIKAQLKPKGLNFHVELQALLLPASSKERA
ncbi:MAG: PfkB family carbohydrate kinase [Candidatus Egerieousia sp.]|nr:PfkB family carbohydrate kinase [Candidatus Egerieousia sp.]MDY5255952.1 PfkB family carbohydrate kinase [Candidatus Egerieousia sp.]